MERWVIIGNLGDKPEMRYLPDGTPVTTLGVAVNRKWTDKNSGQPREHTTWYRCTAWRRAAEVLAQYLDKGDQIYLEGHPNTDDYGNPKLWFDREGKPRTSFEMTIDMFQLCGGRRGSGSGTGNGRPYTGNDAAPDYEDEIPF